MSVPCTSLFKTVTVRCGHCTNLLPVNMRGLLLPSPNQFHHLGHSFFSSPNNSHNLLVLLVLRLISLLTLLIVFFFFLNKSVLAISSLRLIGCVCRKRYQIQPQTFWWTKQAWMTLLYDQEEELMNFQGPQLLPDVMRFLTPLPSLLCVYVCVCVSIHRYPRPPVQILWNKCPDIASFLKLSLSSKFFAH